MPRQFSRANGDWVRLLVTLLRGVNAVEHIVVLFLYAGVWPNYLIAFSSIAKFLIGSVRL